MKKRGYPRRMTWMFILLERWTFGRFKARTVMLRVR